MPERRLAITIKGAVSLGAYEAGAIAETLSLIAYNNTNNPGHPWYIDALCGASAGSMTSGTVAAALVRGDTTLMHKTWVTGVSLGVLAANDHMSDNNVLDALALDAIARQYLTCPVTATPHPALRPAPSTVKLRFTLARFAPAVISGQTLNQTTLSFHEYKDWADFKVAVAASAADPAKLAVNFAASGIAPSGYHNAAQDLTGADAWSALVQTAIASGSFPFAFAPRDLRRWLDGAWIDRYFQDGGTFDNDPVGQTINIAHDIDWFDPAPPGVNYDDGDRRFMMIHTEPFVDSAPEVMPDAPKILDVNPLELAGRYFPAILEESQNSGLRGIVAVNAQVAERSRFLNATAGLVAAGTAPVVPRTVIDALGAFRKIDPGRIDYFRKQFIPDLKETDQPLSNQVNAFPPAQQESFTTLGLAYDLATNLADKTALRPIVIAPDELLSGSGIFAFGGFLVQRLRERDYAQGVYDAYQAWQAVATADGHFVVDPSAPYKPPSAPELFPACEDEYKAGIERLLQRIDCTIGALCRAISGGGIFGGAKAKALEVAVDAIANYYVRKTSSGG